MTKKHFIAFANEIRWNTTLSLAERIAAANVVIAVARADNPRFDKDRFLKACGLA